MSLGIKLSEARKREYRQKGYWGDATLADYWNMSVLSFPDKIAVIDVQGSQYTYAELNEAAGKTAAYLKEVGVKPGDFVSVQLPGWSEFVIIYVACMKVGAVLNPILPNLREGELTYILNKCESKVLFIPSLFRKYDYTRFLHSLMPNVPSLEAIVFVEKDSKVEVGISLEQILHTYSPLAQDSKYSADDLAAVLFTSGTEGLPKGVMLTHNNIIASEKAYAARFNLTYQDVILMPAPIAHATGFHHGVTATILLGAKCVFQDIFKPDISLELIEREKCTCGNGATALVYDIMRTLKNREYNISSLRFFLCGGAPVPRHMVKNAMDMGIKVIGVYGSTESVPHAAASLNDPLEKFIYTDGKPLPGVEIKIVDELRQQVPAGIQGEEASRGPNVFVGYLKEPGLTNRALDDEGWFYSGDLCIMDDDGFISISGRKKDIIIRGGENISSSEVESILLQHPNILEAAVVGMPDKRLGEKTCAYLVLKDCEQGLTIEEVQDFFMRMNIAKYKFPERIEIWDQLPRTESCKIKKYILREDIKNQLNLSVVG
ncbi:medium-chain fatty-acid--CoA ligase [Bacillus sp. B15-48]|uniref:medium-chain fatty-acid--CoA ligase n=1 Tax=Bacillus sp. B15-48 TaxID=1548601 RepID=UPI00193FE3AF|nr:medium-chain fatty-acid--CoA ligase [Bacillus sp. B15-48]MBM4762861.1 medium-chain fatty-acid--CoA ligase [Bacillus sp. B15-48]